MKENGRKIVCDRCGQSTFVRCNGEGEMDGGYTRWNKFEQAEGWQWEHGVGDLCPECSKEWNEMQEAFKRKIAKWTGTENET